MSSRSHELHLVSVYKYNHLYYVACDCQNLRQQTPNMEDAIKLMSDHIRETD